MQGGRISTAVSKIETSVISFEEAHVMAQAAAGLLYGAQTRHACVAGIMHWLRGGP